jgi:hypothetical protein
MFKYLKDEQAYKGMMKEIHDRPNYDYMKEADIAIMDIDVPLALREEKYMGGKMAEIVPGVRASNRAYTGFLNRLRADNFDYLFDRAIDQYNDAINSGMKPEKAAKLDPRQNTKLLKNIATFINTASGRGNIKGLERTMVAMNSVLFSPRLTMSRFQLLNPVYYIKLEPFARKAALKSTLGFAGSAMTVLGLAKLAGAKVETDMRNADFGKIKFGNTRLDLLAGFGQYIRPVAQMISGRVISSTTGKTMTLGEGYKPLTRWDILLRSAEMKEAPIVSFITSLLQGKDPLGKPLNIPKEVYTRFIPMILQDAYDIAVDDPKLLPLTVFGAMGMGLQTYSGKEPIDKYAERYFDKGEKEARKEANDYVKSLTDKKEQEKAIKRFQNYGQMKDIEPGDRGYWLTLKSAAPDIRARDFYARYKDSNEKEKKEMIATAKKIGGIWTEAFLQQIQELKKNEPTPKPTKIRVMK